MTCLLWSIVGADPTLAYAKHAAPKPALFFVDGQVNGTLLRVIRRATEPRVTFNERFSRAYVPCGPGCDSYWFVDRKTGGVVEVPQSPEPDLMVSDVEACRNSAAIRVTYAKRDGTSGRDIATVFRLRENKFVVQDQSKWPKIAHARTADGEYCLAIEEDGPIF